MARINKQSEHLFQEFGRAGDFRRDDQPDDDDPGAEIDRLVQKKLSADKELDYGAAWDLVMADPDNRTIVQRYHDQRN